MKKVQVLKRLGKQREENMIERLCQIKGCYRKYSCKGWCKFHYNRNYIYGNPMPTFIVKQRMPKKQSIEYMHIKRFGGMRMIVLDRDGWKCVKCGMTQKQHKERFKCSLTINHIDHQGRYVSSPNNNIDNLETLCLRCHGSKDAIKHGKYAIYGRKGDDKTK